MYAPFVEAEGGLPNLATIESLITAKTRAILVVSPSNPTGAISPPETLRELFEEAGQTVPVDAPSHRTPPCG